MTFRLRICALASLCLAACPGDDGPTTDAASSSGTTDGGASSGDGSTSSASTSGDVSGASVSVTSPTTGSTSGATTSGATPSFAADVWPILQPSCSCHTQMTPGPPTGLDMGPDAAAAFSQLVGVPSSSVPGVDLIEPGMPSMSYLYLKLTNMQASVGGAGSSMPQGGSLPADQLATIEAWIAGGAPP